MTGRSGLSWRSGTARRPTASLEQRRARLRDSLTIYAEDRSGNRDWQQLEAQVEQLLGPATPARAGGTR